MARMIKTWREYTRDAHFREVFRSGSLFINLKPEVVQEAVQRHYDVLAEEEEVKRLVRDGEITTENDVLAYYDKSISKQMAIIARKKEQEFQKSLLTMTPKQREKAITVRNLIRAVFKRAIERITTKEGAMADARAVLKLHEQGVGPGGEGVLAKLIAEEKRVKALPVHKRPTDLQRYVAKEVD